MTSKAEKKSSLKRPTGVLDYLQKSLPKPTLIQLYADEARGHYVCRAVLQQLSGTAQQVVVRLSCCGGSFPKKGVLVWTKSNEAFLQDLQKWAIIQNFSPNDEKGQIQNCDTIVLTPEYYKGLRCSLESMDSSPWTTLPPAEIIQMATKQKLANFTPTKLQMPNLIPSPEDLERYTEKKWNAVLHFLVGTDNGEEDPPPAVVHFLLQTGLMQTDPDYRGMNEDDAPLVISTKGYDFMLQEQHQQVWHFVVQYLKVISAKKSKRLIDALLFLMCLSFGRLGDGYLESSLRKSERVLMKDLAMFGLLYVVEIGGIHTTNVTEEGPTTPTKIFYPTRVAIQLVQGKGTSTLSSKSTANAVQEDLQMPNPSGSSHLAIIAQTNFMVCAYTTSELHVSMLGLFCDVKTIRRLPNMVFMVLTRDSVKAAFALGIQARQILCFLEKHAHPKLLQSGQSPIPGNVQDQIWLWDRERHRVQWSQVLVHSCMLPGEFRAVQQYTMDTNAHAWSSESRNEVFLEYAEAERVMHFVRQWRAKFAAKQAVV